MYAYLTMAIRSCRIPPGNLPESLFNAAYTSVRTETQRSFLCRFQLTQYVITHYVIITRGQYTENLIKTESEISQRVI